MYLSECETWDSHAGIRSREIWDVRLYSLRDVYESLGGTLSFRVEESFTLKMEPVVCSSLQISWYHIPEDRNLIFLKLHVAVKIVKVLSNELKRNVRTRINKTYRTQMFKHRAFYTWYDNGKLRSYRKQQDNSPRSSAKKDSPTFLWYEEPHRKGRVQQFSHCCVSIRCLCNAFTEPLPSNDRGIHIQTYRTMGEIFEVRCWEGLRCHNILQIRSFIKIASSIRKLTRGIHRLTDSIEIV
jgi:hypothetical protein